VLFRHADFSVSPEASSAAPVPTTLFSRSASARITILHYLVPRALPLSASESFYALFSRPRLSNPGEERAYTLAEPPAEVPMHYVLVLFSPLE